ncbi:MAG TPA: hypothetical protein VHQ92_06655 [Pseudolabrys sp.]|nr:hypothetical protein [Pseudolabrys sp.]
MNEKIGVQSEWRALRGIDTVRLSEARLQAHTAAQWLARAARAYSPPQPDDGHTSLIWDRAIDGLKTQPLKNGMRFSLQLSNLTLALSDGNGPAGVQSIFLSGRTDAEVRTWLGGQLGKRGIDAVGLDATPPYQIPAHAIAKGAPYDAAVISADALAELAAWFSNAELLLNQIQSQLIERKLAVSPVCCWPHHFDLAALTTLPKHTADATGYVGIGLSPGDEYYPEPYFYVSVYPKPDPAMLPTLPMFGHWHTHEFMAAVVPAHKIVAARNQRPETIEFLHCAVDAALKILM